MARGNGRLVPIAFGFIEFYSRFSFLQGRAAKTRVVERAFCGELSGQRWESQGAINGIRRLAHDPMEAE